jgi:DNA-binding LytR/AlgR family response regulator
VSASAPRRWFGLAVGDSPAFKRVLVVDDNDFYAEQLTTDLAARGAQVERACNAAEGMDLLERRGADFDAVVTDISMETELAGLKVLRKARRCGFRGRVATATTGLDSWWGFTINRFVLGVMYRSDYLIPKKPIVDDGHVLWIQVRD